MPRHEMTIRLEAGLLVAGGGGDGRRAVTTTGNDGEPIIPGSTLKGVIRHAYERLFGSETSGALFGEPGREPRDERVKDDEVDGPWSRFIVGDARPPEVGRAKRLLVDKPQVAIDADTGRAADGRLFTRRTVAPFAELDFVARCEIDDLDAEERRRLDAAIRSVVSLGAGRSAGLGRVQIELSTEACPRLDDPGIEGEITAFDPAGGAGDWLVDLVADEPLNLGTERLLGNYFPSRHHIAAATLRGAVITAAMAHRGVRTDQSDDPAFSRLLLDPGTCLRFGDAWPVRDPGRSVPVPAPLSAVRCKLHADHPASDGLISGALRWWLAARSRPVGRDAKCPRCAGPLARVQGVLGAESPSRSFRTRVRMDPETGRAQDEHLFAVELLAAGTRFRARLGAVDGAGHQLLVDAARRGLFVGHGRGQGYGRMRIASLRRRPVDRPLAARLREFDARWRAAIETVESALGLSLGAPRHALAITLRSPLVLPRGTGAAIQPGLLEALRLDDVRILDSHLRAAQRSGWSSLHGRPKTVEAAVAAGSVLLLGTDTALDGLTDRLAELEARGAGERREEGYGWVRIGDPADDLAEEANRG